MKGIRRIGCIGAVFLALALMPAVSGVTAAAEDLKVGIINTARILAESDYGKKLQEKFGDEMKEQQAELEKKREEVKENQQLLQTAQKNQKSAVKLEELNDALEKSVREFKWMKEDLDKNLREMDQALVRDMRAKLQLILAQYVEDTEYAVIMERQRVASASSRVDVTEDIIELLDKNYD
ncbi:MAG: OmpH family outer membrane protein [Desulfosudaceae bacterium]